MNEQNWLEVYRATNAVDAHIVAGALENAGIDVRIDGEALVGGVGMLPPGWSTSPRLLVVESDAEEARRIIAEGESGSLRSEDASEEDTNEDAAS